MSDKYSDAEMIAGLVQFFLSAAVFLGCLYMLVVSPRINRKRLPRARYARQIRAGIEAALRGDQRTDGRGNSLECRAFNRTLSNAPIRKSRRRLVELSEQSNRHQKALQASIARMQDLIDQHSKAKARRLFQQRLADQEVLELEFQLNYPHPSMNDSISDETIEHIAACLFCRRSHFSWLFDEAT